MNGVIKKLFFFVVCGVALTVQPLPALSATANPLDPYIEAAKKEGSVTLGLTLRETSHGKPAASLYVAAFQKRYPFLKVNFKRIGGARERERIIVEMASGIFDYDVATVTDTMVPTIVDAKLPRILDWKKLGASAIFVHPKNYGLSLRTQAYGIAYNRDQISDEVAKTFTWETCTDSKWKGKITMNDRPRHLIVLSRGDGWGQAKTLDYAKRWAANKPAFNESQSDATEKVSLGVYAMGCGIARGQVRDIQVNAGSKSLGIVFPEPVPIDSSDLIYVPDKAKHPSAAILFMVWSTTPEAQNLQDDIDYTGHPAIDGTDINKALKGKKVLYPSWTDVGNADNRLAEILQAMGVPVVR